MIVINRLVKERVYAKIIGRSFGRFLIDPVAMHNGPDPTDYRPAEEELEESEKESLTIKLLVTASRDHSTPPWEEDVEDE